MKTDRSVSWPPFAALFLGCIPVSQAGDGDPEI